MKIVEYHLLTTNDGAQFTRAAEARVSQGWQPFGGVSCAVEQGKIIFAQSFVKYGDPKPGTTVSLMQDKQLIGHCTVLENADGRLVLDISHLG